jgi:hypothetical protein
MKIKIRDVGRLFGHELPSPPGRSKCPLQKHSRDDKTFRVYASETTGDELWKCWSCDDPDNTGDAIKLYALLAHIDNGEAFKRLKEQGYDIGSPTYEVPRERPKVPARGTTAPESAITLDEAILSRFRKEPAAEEVILSYCKKRCLDASVCRQHMVGLPREFHWLDRPGAVGFVYVDPVRHVPCRIKVRSLHEKRFFVLPKGEKDSGQRAKAPLYLAENLKLAPRLPDGSLRVALVTEGEVDALSLLSVGIKNVVSLPDGSKSAETCDLLPLMPFSIWLLAFDNDGPGKEAAAKIRERAKRYGNDTVSVVWSRTKPDGSTAVYKDTNEALMDGMGRDEFVAAVDRRLEEQYGWAVPWIRAA